MLKTIKGFFDKHIAASPAPQAPLEHRLQLATAALLIEVARADHQHHEQEFAAMRAALEAKFRLSAEEIAALMDLAAQEAERATSYYQFTSLINKHFTPEQKVHVIELMWQVAFADQHMDKYEEHLVRKVAELLYVPHRDFIAAKHRALEAGGQA